MLAAAIMMVVAVPVFADQWEHDWADGNEAFRNGDFSVALEAFTRAREAGLSGPAVHYNIAVCQYKLGRFDRAGRTFAGIARDYPQMAGLAQYNLGLVARKLGKNDAATRHFLRAYRLSPDDEKLRILASNRLAEADLKLPARRRIRGAFGVRAGYDDNVALRDTTAIGTGTTDSSAMTDVFAALSGPLTARFEELSFEANLYSVRYFDADEFDQNGLAGGLLYTWQGGNWRLNAGPTAGAGWLGGDAFDRRVGARFTARRSLDDGAVLHLGYVFDDIREGDDLYRGIDGRRQVAETRYTKTRTDGVRLDVRLRYERNDRRDPGVSPTRTGVSVDYSFPVIPGWSLEAGVQLRRSRFEDVALPRDEDLLTLEASMLKRLSPAWTLFLEYRYSDNDSDDPLFSYERNVFSVGAMRGF